MEYVKLEGLYIKVSRLSLGCWQLGGHGWGKVSEADMIKAVYKALDLGITLFDTAPIYGLGHSEELLGEVLQTKRQEVIIATKVGLTWENGKYFKKFNDCSPENINREIEASLKRLNTDYVDIYQIHWPDPDNPIEDTMVALEKLRAAGKIRLIGCCNFPLPLLKRALKAGRIDIVQVLYNLIDREVEKDLLPFCRDKNIAVLTYSPIARGLLTGKYDKDTKFGADDHRGKNRDKYFSDEALPRNLRIVDKVKCVAKKMNKTSAQVALRWLMQSDCVTSAIFGAKNSDQLEENVAASGFTLSSEDMEFLSK